MKKRLYKKKQGAMIGGVCAGLSEYFDLDVSIVRIIVVLLAFATQGFVIILYLIMCVCLPSEVMVKTEDYYSQGIYTKEGYKTKGEAYKEEAKEEAKKDEFINEKFVGEKGALKPNKKKGLGLLFVVLGLVLLVNEFIPSFLRVYFLPLTFIIIGLGFIASAMGLFPQTKEVIQETFFEENLTKANKENKQQEQEKDLDEIAEIMNEEEIVQVASELEVKDSELGDNEKDGGLDE